MNNKLVGMPEVKEIAKTISANADKYELGMKKKPKYIVLLDKGQGRTKLLEYIAGIYNEQITFPSGLDAYVEFENVDATLSAVEELGLQLSDAAVYKSHYEEVCGVDISSFAKHLNESQTGNVIELLKDTSKHCIMFFFFPQKPNKSEQKLIDMIYESMNISDTISVSPYCADDYAQIVIEHYKTLGFDSVNSPSVKKNFLKHMKDVSSINEAFEIGEMLIGDNESEEKSYTDESKKMEVNR